MTSYLIKRILIMIPTYLGVSLMIWLVMTLAPGEPEGASEGGAGPEGALGGVGDLESQDRNVRIFRRQFNLDRPRFFNTWTDLDVDEVQDALVKVDTGVSGLGKDGPTLYKEAKRKLDDWSHYAVPALVELLARNQGDPELQFLTLRRLRQAAYTYRTVYPAGYRPTPEERARDKEIDRENALIESAELKWAPDASAEERAQAVENWQAWFEERKERWEYSFGDKVRVALTDTQFGKYWGNLLKGDLGLSVKTKEPVTEMIFSRFKYSLSLAVPAFLIAWVLAVFLGVFGATNHNTAGDQIIGVVLFMLYSIPTFVMAMLLQRWPAAPGSILAWLIAVGIAVWFSTRRTRFVYGAAPRARLVVAWLAVIFMSVRVLQESLPVGIFAVAMTILTGVVAWRRERETSDPTQRWLGVTHLLICSAFTFFGGVMLSDVLVRAMGVFPSSNFESANAVQNLNTWEHFKDVLRHITLPLIAYTYGSLAYISRQARSGMLEVLRADFVRTARAKGCSERTVVWKHGVRNGMMPIVTLLGTALPILIAGSVFIETVFNIDGFGKLMVNSILSKDYNVVMGIQLIVAALTLIGLLLTDLIYAAMDPRISFK